MPSGPAGVGHGLAIAGGLSFGLPRQCSAAMLLAQHLHEASRRHGRRELHAEPVVRLVTAKL